MWKIPWTALMSNSLVITSLNLGINLNIAKICNNHDLLFYIPDNDLQDRFTVLKQSRKL